MIARIIQWCVHNRAMVLLLTGFLVLAGAWSTFNITVDAIPDRSAAADGVCPSEMSA